MIDACPGWLAWALVVCLCMSITLPSLVDVAIVGAGPAGLAAAERLLSEGLSLAIIDSRPRTGHPLRCGEITFASYFNEIGVEPRPSWVRWRLDQGRMLVLNRPCMEQEWAEDLAARGVKLAAGVAVTGVSEFTEGARTLTLIDRKQQRTIRARTVIAADGVSSRVGQLAGLSTRLSMLHAAPCLAYRIVDAQVKHPDRYILQFIKHLRPLYFWVIPNGLDSANVGLSLLGHRGHAAKPILDKILANTDLINGGRVVETVVGWAPSAPPMSRPYADGILLAGTAARLIGADLLDGIFYAGQSGRLAGQAVALLQGQVASSQRLAVYEQLLVPLQQQLQVKWQRRLQLEAEL